MNSDGGLIQGFNANQTGGPGYVSFLTEATDSSPWRSVRFFDNQANSNTWQIDNVSYSNVPTPALLPGLVGLGVAALRKRSKSDDESPETSA